MAPLRLEVNVMLTFESLLLYAAGFLALYDRTLFLKQLQLAETSGDDADPLVPVLVNLIGVFALGFGVLLSAINDVNNAAPAESAFLFLPFVDVAFAAVSYGYLKERVHAEDWSAIGYVAVAALFAVARFYYGYIAGVAIPRNAVLLNVQQTASPARAQAAPAPAPAPAAAPAPVPTGTVVQAARAVTSAPSSPVVAPKPPKSPRSVRVRKTVTKA